jgi:guanylate kinase
MKQKGILIVISGFSGAGKGTLMKALTGAHEEYALSISATTRGMREGEQDGVDYFFVKEERFREMIKADELYEYAEYQDNYYGTPREYVDRQMAEGKDVILEIDVRGAANIKQKFPDTVLIFVTPPTAEELRNRLVRRGTESEEKIAGRLARAAEEAVSMPLYDYVLINDDLERSVAELHAIIRTEHAKCSRNSEFIQDITDQVRRL